MTTAVLRQHFYFRHGSRDAVQLLGGIGAAIREINLSIEDVELVGLLGDPTIDRDGIFVVAVIHARLGWEVIGEKSLLSHGLRCRRYI